MQRYFSNKLSDSLFVLSKDDLYHIKKVMRLKDGEEIEIVYNDSLFIASLKGESALMKEKIETLKVKKNITLCLPLLTDSKFSLILQKATELGVNKIIPIELKRSIVKINDIEKKKLRWLKICKEASEQSKRLDIPTIDNVTKLKDLDVVGDKFICSTTKCNSFKSMLNVNNDVTFVIGPEGGLTNDEEELLKSMGFVPISLGDNILRVETVPIVLLGIINYERE